MDTRSHPPHLLARAHNAHKGSVGRVLVVGGSLGMAGAPALAALGALRAGAGLVNVAVPSAVQPTVAAYRPEWMTTPLGPDTAVALGTRGADTILEIGSSFDAIVLGPGLGRRDTTQDAVRRITNTADCALVLDADALFAFRGETQLLTERNAPTVITPHEGEAARLLGTTADAVRADRDAAAAQLASETHAIVVLKGPGTLVRTRDHAYENRSGNPLLATGGTGDVLAGMCAALIAQASSDLDEVRAFDAICAAVYAHGAAADAIARGRDRGVLASEIADAVPDALASLYDASLDTAPLKIQDGA